MSHQNDALEMTLGEFVALRLLATAGKDEQATPQKDRGRRDRSHFGKTPSDAYKRNYESIFKTPKPS